MNSPSFANPKSRLPEATNLRNPLQDMQTDVDQKIYIACLERQVLRFATRDVQLRAALEAATGRPYDNFDPSALTFEQICEVIAADLARGLNLSIDEARSLVARHNQTANPSQMENTFQG